MPKITTAGGISWEPGHEPGAGEGHVREVPVPAAPVQDDVRTEVEEVREELERLEAEVDPEAKPAPGAAPAPPRVPPRRTPPKPAGDG